MKRVKLIIAWLMIMLMLIPVAVPADGDGSSADLIGGGDSGGSSSSETDVNVGDETTIEAGEWEGESSTTTETETHESETEGEGTSTDSSSTEAAAISDANAVMDTIAERLSKYSGSSPVTYLYQTDQMPGFTLVETVKIPVKELEKMAEDGIGKIDKSVQNKQNEKNKVETRGLTNWAQAGRIEMFNQMFGDVYGSEDFRANMNLLLTMNSAQAYPISAFPPLPNFDFDLSEILAALNDQPLSSFPDLPANFPSEEQLLQMIDDLDDMDVSDIEGLPQSRPVYDFYSYRDRYLALRTYLYLCTIADVKTVNVQHVIEMKVESCSRSLTIRQTPVPYPAGIGYGDGSYMYAWAVEILDSEYEDDVGASKILGVTKDKNLNYLFSTKGKYKFTYSQNIKKTVVSAVAYNLYEYWYIPQTGQIIYRREILGSLNMAGADSESGRAGDRMAAYIGERTEYAYMTEGNEYGVAGRQMGVKIYNAHANGDAIPDMAAINDRSYTYRVE